MDENWENALEEWDDSEDDGNENQNVEEWRSGDYGGMDFQVDPRYVQRFRKKIGRKGEGYDSDNMLSLPLFPSLALCHLARNTTTKDCRRRKR